MRFFASSFFHRSPFPKPLIITLGSFQIFSKICGDILKSRRTTGVNDTGGKFATSGNLQPVVTTLAANLPPVSTTPAANFATSSLELLTPVANLPPLSTIPAANYLPPVSRIPVANLPPVSMTPVSMTPVANCHRYQ